MSALPKSGVGVVGFTSKTLVAIFDVYSHYFVHFGTMLDTCTLTRDAMFYFPRVLSLQ